MAYIRTSNATPTTTTSITLAIDGLDYSASSYYALNLYFDDNPDTLIQRMNDISGGASGGKYYSGARTVANLSPNTWYYFECRARYTSTSNIEYMYASFKTEATYVPPPPSDDHSDSISNATQFYTSVGGNIETNGDVDYFKFVATNSGTHTFYSTGSTDVVGTLYNSSNNELINNDDGGAQFRQFSFDYYLSSGSTYYVRVTAYGTGAYNLYVTAPQSDDHGNTAGTATLVTLGTTNGNINTSGDVDYFLFTPTSSGKHRIYATGSTDTQGTLYNSNGTTQLAYDDDGGSTYGNGTNFWIEYELVANTSYYIKVNGWNTSIGTYVLNITQLAKPAELTHTVTNITKNSFTVNFFGGAGATSRRLEVRENNDSGTMVHNTNNAISVASNNVTGLKEYSTYYVKTYASNDGVNSDWKPSTPMTLDATNPTVTIQDGTGDGKMWLDFTGADVNPAVGGASGLHSYGLWISNANGALVGNDRHATVSNLSTSYYTFETDYSGKSFVPDATYIMAVRSFDVSGNSSPLATKTVTYKRVRPIQGAWNWQSGYKYAGNNFNITAVEWISLGKVINQFRNYRNINNNLPPVDFPEPKAGDTITATIFNQYRTAIAEITPKGTAPPSIKSSGSLIMASDFNLLVQSMNSIT